MTALVSLLVEVKFSTADYTQARDCAELMRQSSFFMGNPRAHDVSLMISVRRGGCFKWRTLC
ncbi:MAG: hypothetical protein EB071_11305, partial [Gammaproteobacteria bacterium]|nr:hypothetical protein [Gammaproteobacteria bacterium]